MRVLHRYIAHDYLVIFAITLAVITFVMCLGAAMKAIDYFARGVSGWVILKLFGYNIPYILTFGIPLSALAASLLLFGRLSYDGEITAMKACGISLWQVIAPVILLSFAFVGICLYLHGSIAPRSHFAQRQLLANAGMEEPVNLLEEGRFVKDFPGFMVYVAKKDKRRVQNVVIYEMGERGVVRNIRAEWGEIRTDMTNRLLLIDLYNVQLMQPDENQPLDPSKARYLAATNYPVRLDINELLEKRNVRKKAVNMTYAELFEALRNVRATFPDLSPDDLQRQRMKLILEINQRVALSLSCFAFVLLGVPLGLKSHRKESSVGIGISLLLAFAFYFFVILADSLVDRPQYRPDLIQWIPIIVAELIGLALIRRTN